MWKKENILPLSVNQADTGSVDNHVNSAEQEKEQVKSLVSNMSHQLKPLAEYFSLCRNLK